MPIYTTRTIVPPATEPVTVQEIRDWLRLDDHAETATVYALIMAAREHVETYTGQPLVERRIEIRTSRLADALILPVRPIREIVSLSYLDDQGDRQTLDPSAYELDAEVGTIVPDYGTRWPLHRDTPGSVIVTAIVGYGDHNAVPQTIKSAIALLVGAWFANREAVSDRPMTVVPMGVEALLGPHRLRVGL